MTAAAPFYYNWFRILKLVACYAGFQRSGPKNFLGRQFGPDFPLRDERVFLTIKHSLVELSSS